MPTIDSDAHVVETEHTWDFMDPSDSALRPIVVAPTSGNGTQYWMIDGKIRGRARGPVAAQGLAESVKRNMVTNDAFRYMEDIPGRLAHMDELDIDVQVLYPTMYIGRMCDRPETEVALSKSYNRWLADIWQQAKGRLRWTCILPMNVMDEALRELDFAVEHGACGITMRSIEDDRLLVDEYFDPLYEKASNLNIPITVHIGSSNDAMNDVLSKDGIGGTFARLRLMSVAACHALITNKTPLKYPDLKFAFVEASAQWIPYMVHDLRRRLETRGRDLEPDVLNAYKIWVTCQMDDDLPYVLKYSGPDSIVVGTDYGHQDQSSEIEALRKMRTRGDVDPAVVDKILGANAIALYNLDL